MLLRCESLEPPMSELGQTLPSRDFCGTAALPPKPDIGWRGWHDRKPAQTRTSARLFDRLVGAGEQRTGLVRLKRSSNGTEHRQLQPLRLATEAGRRAVRRVRRR